MNDLFLDANICVYAFDKGEPTKQNTAKALLNKRPCISSQVIIETFLACTRKLKMRQVTCEENTRFLCDITTVVPIDSYTFTVALRLKNEFKFSFLDSVIIASALEANCATLYSEDMHHGQVIEGTLKIVNPFLIS